MPKRRFEMFGTLREKLHSVVQEGLSARYVLCLVGQNVLDEWMVRTAKVLLSHLSN
jgi:hypothetical protein